MSNELRILPLRRYEVHYTVPINQNDEERVDVFTADYHGVNEGRNIFYRTGNVVREYQMRINQIVVTPVDDSDEEIPA